MCFNEIQVTIFAGKKRSSSSSLGGNQKLLKVYETLFQKCITKVLFLKQIKHR